MSAMPMKIEKASAAQIRYVALNMRQRDIEEFSAVSATNDPKMFAEVLTHRYAGRDDVLCGSLDGVPICIGGTIEVWPNVISLLFLATDDFPKIGRSITRFIRRELFPRYFAAGVHRIQAISLDGYTEVHAWLKAIGLEQETGPMRGYGKSGEAFLQFAKVRDVRSPGA